MTARQFPSNLKRILEPAKSNATVELQPPIELDQKIKMQWGRLLMPLIMIVGMGGMMAMMFGSGGLRSGASGGGGMNMYGLMFPLMMLGSMGYMFTSSGGIFGNTAELNSDRAGFLRGLGKARKTVREGGEAQYAHAAHRFPAPETLDGIIGGPRQWERSSHGSPDEGVIVRYGRGRVRTDVEVTPPKAAPKDDGFLEQVSTISTMRFVKSHSRITVPIGINLSKIPALGLRGDRAAIRGLTRSMIAQAVTFYSPDRLSVISLVDDPEDPEWAWLKWLPHHQHPTELDALGPARMTYRTLAELRAALQTELGSRTQFHMSSRNTAMPGAGSSNTLGQRHLLVVCDTATPYGVVDALDGVTWLELGSTEQTLSARKGATFIVDEERELTKLLSTPGAVPLHTGELVDQLPVEDARVLARSLAHWKAAGGIVSATTSGEKVDEDRSFSALMGVRDLGDVDLTQRWAFRSITNKQRLQFRLGYERRGAPFLLDIKEDGEDGMGPHGMLIGATGSGKSETLRTLIASAVLDHSPDELNLLLVDFKDGSAFAGLDRSLNHIVAVVTNMEEEAEFLDRFYDVLDGELDKRGRILRESGERTRGVGFPNVKEYELAREEGANLEPLPALFIVIDEFTELLTQKGEFADLFVRIGRLGRAYRIYILFASQKIEEGKMKGLQSHLSYRIALKTFSAQDSRDVIADPAAFHIEKGAAGTGYLRYLTQDLVQFRAAYTGGKYRRPISAAVAPGREGRRESAPTAPVPSRYIKPHAFTAGAVALPDPGEVEEEAVEIAPEPEKIHALAATEFEKVVEQLSGKGRPARQMWLPPLKVSLTLEKFIPDFDKAVQNTSPATLQAPVALADFPHEHAQRPYMVDLTSEHLAIIGAGRTGKSTACQTLIASLALTHTPEQLQIYGLDFSRGALAAMTALPHVGSVAQRSDRDRIRVTMGVMDQILRRRERLFQEYGISSMEEYRRRRADAAEGPELVAKDPHGDVVLVIDGFDTGIVENGPLGAMEQATVADIARGGQTFGIHLVLTASLWNSIRPQQVKALMGNAIEFRLSEPVESEVNRTVAKDIPVTLPGRCQAKRVEKHMMIALPRVDGVSDYNTLNEGIADLAQRLAALYPARRAPSAATLPPRIDMAEILTTPSLWTPPAPDSSRQIKLSAVPFGLAEATMKAATFDFVNHPHAFAFGDPKSGRSTWLSAVIKGICTVLPTDEEAMFVTLDYRRAHYQEVPAHQSMGYASSREKADELCQQLAQVLSAQRRMPDRELSLEELHARSWWDGPDIFVIVDDYQMVDDRVSPFPSPLLHLTDFIEDGWALGVHFLIARNMEQASSARIGPVMSKMTAATGLMLSGDRNEGPVIGNHRPERLVEGRTKVVDLGAGTAQWAQIGWMPTIADRVGGGA